MFIHYFFLAAYIILVTCVASSIFPFPILVLTYQADFVFVLLLLLLKDYIKLKKKNKRLYQTLELFVFCVCSFANVEKFELFLKSIIYLTKDLLS